MGDNICPITGKICAKEKICHITDKTPDGFKELHLCQDCSAPFIGGDPFAKPPPLAAPLDKIVAQSVFNYLNQILQTNVVPLMPPSGKEGCPTCGCTIQDIASKGRIGCQDCYKWYRSELMNVMQKAHGSTTHKGKKPKTQFCAAQLETLKKKLEEAIKKESYEDAAVLRDIIKKMEA